MDLLSYGGIAVDSIVQFYLSEQYWR